MLFIIPLAMILVGVLAGLYLAVPYLIVISLISIGGYYWVRWLIRGPSHGPNQGFAGLLPLMYAALALFANLIMWVIYFSTDGSITAIWITITAFLHQNVLRH